MAARSAENGGPAAALRGLFRGLPPESFAGAMERSGVSPAALASGYAVFFLYSCAIGVFAVVLTLVVMRARAVGNTRQT